MLTLASVPDHPGKVYSPKQPSIQRPMNKAFMPQPFTPSHALDSMSTKQS